MNRWCLYAVHTHVALANHNVVKIHKISIKINYMQFPMSYLLTDNCSPPSSNYTNNNMASMFVGCSDLRKCVWMEITTNKSNNTNGRTFIKCRACGFAMILFHSRNSMSTKKNHYQNRCKFAFTSLFVIFTLETASMKFISQEKCSLKI